MPAKKSPHGTAVELAALIRLTTRRVAQLVTEGVISRLPDGTYDLADSIERFYIFKIQPPESLDYAEEKAKHEKVKRELAELELARQRGQVHASEDVELVMTDMLTNLRAQLLAIPAKLAPALADRSREHIYAVLEAEIKDRLTELSDYKPSLFLTDEAKDDSTLPKDSE